MFLNILHMVKKMENILEIDLSSIEHNLSQIRGHVGHGSRIMGVVKSDAYGHGLLEVSKSLEKNGIDCLAVAHIHEALELRKQGIGLPVVILCGLQSRSEACAAVENGLTPVIFDFETAEILSSEGLRRGKKISAYIKLDTGMGRLGIYHEEALSLLGKIIPLRNIEVSGFFSHLSSADEDTDLFTEKQIGYFKNVVKAGRSMGAGLPLNSLANSAGLISFKGAQWEMVRPGIILYGGLPRPDFSSPIPLRPAMRFRSRIIQIREMPGKTPISYGRTYYTQGPRRIAVVSAGYGDGLPRGMSNRGSILIGGIPAPIRGRICMNLTGCDITGIQGVRQGDDAVFLGTQGDNRISADDMARWALTISYELFCSLGRANKRIYL